MGAGVIGFEVDGAFAPDVLNVGSDDLVDTNVTTLMANLIIGAPIGAPGVRPYVSGGAGLLRTSVSSADDFFDIDDNSFGVNAGAGVMVFVRENFGLRGDLRYFRSLRDSDSGDGIDVVLGSFDFWRATVGATFRF
jgi:opacity protein-like surface antigen